MVNTTQRNFHHETSSNTISSAGAFLQTNEPAYLDYILQFPFESGYERGWEWAKTVSFEVVKYAATKLTSSESIRNSLAGSTTQRADSGESHDKGGLFGFRPSSDNADAGTHDHVASSRTWYQFYKESQRGVGRRGHSANEKHAVSEVLSPLFYDYEDGWTKAVREHYLNVIKDN